LRTAPDVTIALSSTMDVLNTFMTDNPVKNSQDQTSKLITELRTTYPQIVFKPADKNLGLVALKLEDYNQMIESHLLDTDQYEPIKFNSMVNNLMFLPGFTTVKGKYTQLKNRYLKTLNSNSEKTQATNWFKSFEEKPWKLPSFYVLPKIHKPGNTSRPILGSTHWITNPISIVASTLLQQRLTSDIIVKNSEQVVKKLKCFSEASERQDRSDDRHLDATRRHTDTRYLVSLDIVNLYPSIQLDLLYKLFTGSTEKLLLDMLKFIFSSNYLSYNGKTYRQKNGIAMGTNCSPNVANYYLLRLIDKIFEEKREVKIPSRFLDDIMFIWIGKHDELLLFIDSIQDLVPGISFTSKIGSEIEFLDISIVLKNNEDIYWYTHQKQLNMYTYISPKSCHPVANLRGWISSELTRYRRLSSCKKLYHTTKQLFYFRLLRRGYSPSFLKDIFEKHLFISQPQPDNHQKVLPFKCKYSYRNNITLLPRLTYNYLRNIQLPTHRITFCWLGSRSILRLLTSSDLTKAQKHLLATRASLAPTDAN
jgi:hypothetical protein